MFGYRIIKEDKLLSLFEEKSKMRLAHLKECNKLQQLIECEKEIGELNKETLKRLDNSKVFETVKLNLNILKHAGPEFIKEIIKNVQFLENDLIKKSTKIRDINGLAYFDGACDFAEKIKFELSQVIKRVVISPNVTDPLTGENIKERNEKRKNGK